MNAVLSEAGAVIAPETWAIGWFEEPKNGSPVMWNEKLGKWLNAREWECFGGEEEAFALWRVMDPEWGEPWNHGVKDCLPVKLPIFPSSWGQTAVVMKYRNGEVEPFAEVLPGEMYWLQLADGSRQEVQWEDGKWVSFLPFPYRHAF